jgi:subtilisin family serine protease
MAEDSLKFPRRETDTSPVIRRLAAPFLVALIAVFASAPAVAAAATPREFPVHAVGITPNDPSYGSQWGAPKMGLPDAWERTTGSSSTVIAIIDTGVDPNQPDLVGRVLPGGDFVGDGLSGDPNGHGTFVARVAAAAGNDGTGIAGACWTCRILPVRVLDASGDGDTGAVSDGVHFAIDQGADIINLSLAGDNSSITLTAAILRAQAAGIPVIAAAGNQTLPGQTLTVPQYPAAIPGVISVAASNTSDSIYSWSFRGTWVQVAAPGCILNNASCGTSYAAPSVAGILALGQAVSPTATSSALTAGLYATVAPVLGGGVAQGRVSASSFLTSITPSLSAQRVSGSSRILTATAISQRVHPTSASAVVLARSDDYADALAAAPLAAELGAPVLLTPPSGLDSAVIAEIQRLGATTAWLIGGESALKPAVESAARAAGITDVRRIDGKSRFDTAARIATEVGGSTVYLATARGYADAVAVSGLAALRRAPILLLERDSVPTETAAALATLAPTSVTVIGGPGAVSDAVVTTLGAQRLFGSTRYETSRLIADAAVAAGADGGRVWVATGGDWPDALAAGPAAAARGGVLLLSDASAATVSTWLGTVTPSEVVVVGGPGVITDATLAYLTSLL